MEKKEFFRIFNLMIAILIIIMALMPCSIPGGEKDLEITLDGISSPIETIDQIDNGTIWVPFRSHVVVPTLDSEMAGDDGNLYAPDILMENGIYKMWYGAQSSDGHDSIHFATSDNGRDWLKYGVTIPTGENNHVNDPSVVKVNDLYYMYYTVAPEDELDEIWAATSENGLNWTLHG